MKKVNKLNKETEDTKYDIYMDQKYNNYQEFKETAKRLKEMENHKVIMDKETAEDEYTADLFADSGESGFPEFNIAAELYKLDHNEANDVMTQLGKSKEQRLFDLEIKVKKLEDRLIKCETENERLYKFLRTTKHDARENYIHQQTNINKMQFWVSLLYVLTLSVFIYAFFNY